MLTEDFCTLHGPVWSLSNYGSETIPSVQNLSLNMWGQSLHLWAAEMLVQMCRADPSRHCTPWKESAMNLSTELILLAKLFKYLKPQSDPFLA